MQQQKQQQEGAAEKKEACSIPLIKQLFETTIERASEQEKVEYEALFSSLNSPAAFFALRSEHKYPAIYETVLARQQQLKKEKWNAFLEKYTNEKIPVEVWSLFLSNPRLTHQECVTLRKYASVEFGEDFLLHVLPPNNNNIPPSSTSAASPTSTCTTSASGSCAESVSRKQQEKEQEQKEEEEEEKAVIIENDESVATYLLVINRFSSVFSFSIEQAQMLYNKLMALVPFIRSAQSVKFFSSTICWLTFNSENAKLFQNQQSVDSFVTLAKNNRESMKRLDVVRNYTTAVGNCSRSKPEAVKLYASNDHLVLDILPSLGVYCVETGNHPDILKQKEKLVDECILSYTTVISVFMGCSKEIAEKFKTEKMRSVVARLQREAPKKDIEAKQSLNGLAAKLMIIDNSFLIQQLFVSLENISQSLRARIFGKLCKESSADFFSASEEDVEKIVDESFAEEEEEKEKGKEKKKEKSKKKEEESEEEKSEQEGEEDEKKEEEGGEEEELLMDEDAVIDEILDRRDELRQENFESCKELLALPGEIVSLFLSAPRLNKTEEEIIKKHLENKQLVEELTNILKVASDRSARIFFHVIARFAQVAPAPMATKSMYSQLMHASTFIELPWSYKWFLSSITNVVITGNESKILFGTKAMRERICEFSDLAEGEPEIADSLSNLIVVFCYESSVASLFRHVSIRDLLVSLAPNCATTAASERWSVAICNIAYDCEKEKSVVQALFGATEVLDAFVKVSEFCEDCFSSRWLLTALVNLCVLDAGLQSRWGSTTAIIELHHNIAPYCSSQTAAAWFFKSIKSFTAQHRDVALHFSQPKLRDAIVSLLPTVRNSPSTAEQFVASLSSISNTARVDTMRINLGTPEVVNAILEASLHLATGATGATGCHWLGLLIMNLCHGSSSVAAHNIKLFTGDQKALEQTVRMFLRLAPFKSNGAVTYMLYSFEKIINNNKATAESFHRISGGGGALRDMFTMCIKEAKSAECAEAICFSICCMLDFTDGIFEDWASASVEQKTQAQIKEGEAQQQQEKQKQEEEEEEGNGMTSFISAFISLAPVAFQKTFGAEAWAECLSVMLLPSREKPHLLRYFGVPEMVSAVRTSIKNPRLTPRALLLLKSSAGVVETIPMEGFSHFEKDNEIDP